MRLNRIALPALLALFVASLSGQTSVLDQPAFSVAREDLQKAFPAGQPGSDPVTVLAEAASFDLGSAGRVVYTRRVVFKVWTKQAAEDWGIIEESWSPWQDDRPAVRARVISPDGSVHELDPKTIADAPVRDDDNNLVSDQRMIRAPLPAMEPGAIVEQEIVDRRNSPTLSAGMVRYYYFGNSVPVERTHLTIRAPETLPLRYKTALLPDVAVRERSESGIHQLDFDQGPMKPVEERVPFLPSSEPRQAHVAFSTAQSWQAIAEEYSAIVEKQIKGFNGNSFLPKFAASATREAKIRTIVEKLDREIRYTGVEFGEASVVPRPPAEVLQRKYGDCKDKAVLAVALLRAAGIEARVALLLSSFGEDVEPELPGMDIFNHAIVYAPGAPDYWLDLTDLDVRPGVIAPENQGRWSLIARPTTNNLVHVPDLSAEQNRVVETREFVLPELGRARIVETSETYGSADREYRSWFGSRSDKELRESLKSYIDTAYGEAKIGRISAGDAEDLSKPFTLRIELEDAQRGVTARTEAAVGIFVSHITARLPRFFREDPKDQPVGKGVEAKEEPQRTQDFEVSEPFIQEWRYKITAPAGFRVRQLPDATQETLGIATLSTRFQRDSDTQVSAELLFAMPKKRFSASEGLKLRDALVELGKRKPLLIFFDQVGETALAEGKVKEALAEFEMLRKLHPTEALHSLQYARALLAAGAGESARAEARRAVQLEPTSATGWVQLAEVLTNDLVGRPLEKGMDHDGAVEAYHKALELDRDNYEARANLAILLEYNGDGIRYGRGGRLDEAIVEYEKILDKLAGLNVAQNYPIALLRASRAQQLRDYLRKQPDSDLNQTLAVCAEAILNGSKSALDRAGEISGVNSKQRVVASAAQTLITVRRYGLAADLMEAAANGSNNPAAVASVVQILRKTRPVEDLPVPVSAPEDAVVLMITRMVGLGHHEKDLQETLSSLLKDDPAFDPRDAKQGFYSALARRSEEGMSPEVALDFFVSAAKFTREGDDEKGYLVRMNVPGMDAANQQAQVVFVVKEDGAYKVLGNIPGVGGVARLALNLVDDGKPELAAVWLDRLRRELPPGNGDDPLSGPMFSRLWQTGSTAPRDPASIKLAAAALADVGNVSAQVPAIAILEGGRGNTTGAAAAPLSAALAEASFQAKQYNKSLAIAEDLVKQLPQSLTAVLLASRAAYAAGGQKGGRRIVDASIGRFDQDPMALRAIAGVAMGFGDVETSAKLTRQIIDSGRATPGDYNQIAWGDLMSAKTGPASLEAANQGVLMMGNRATSGLLHTLAAVDADIGKETEARAVLLQHMKLDGSPEPLDADWYVFGRIAEEYGLTKDASAMYRRLERPKTDLGLAASSYALAQRRLAGLQLQGK